MKQFFIISIIFMICFCVNSKASHLLEKLQLFGIYEDKTINPEIERIAPNLLDSIQVDLPPPKGGSKKYPPRIAKIYSFTQMPCINVLYLRPGGRGAISAYDPKHYVLFNMCDTTFYYFGDPIERFSDVVRGSLADIISEDRILDLISLYLNTFDVRYPYFLLRSFEDFENIYDTIMVNKPDLKIFYPDSLWLKDKKSVNAILRHMRKEKIDDTHEIELYSWNYANGNIESWIFRISNDFIKVIDRNLVLERVGPFNPLPHY